MVFRCRQYDVTPGKLDAFNTFFRDRLLPVQLRHGAQLVGRWQSEDGTQILAVWAYRDNASADAISEAVASDADAVDAQRHRHAELEPLFTSTSEFFATSTVPLELTELRHLG